MVTHDPNSVFHSNVFFQLEVYVNSMDAILLLAQAMVLTEHSHCIHEQLYVVNG